MSMTSAATLPSGCCDLETYRCPARPPLREPALRADQVLTDEYPDAAVWFVRIGHRALHRIGGRPSVGHL
jgi:hypothetical protein